MKCSFVRLAAAPWALTILLSLCAVPSVHSQHPRHHVPEAVAASRALGALPAVTRMNLAIGLPLRNQEELGKFLSELADPASPNFQNYLTPEQFAERFGPSREDYDALSAFMRANRLDVTGTHPNRMILDVSGSAADIERTFHIRMVRWHHADRGAYFAPDREPSLDAGVTILDITGLDNFVVPRPMDLKTLPLNAISLTTGSGPAGLFLGNDFRAAYAPGVALNGAGQSVGLFELDGFYASDVAANFKQAGLPPIPVQTVLLNGYNGAPGGANIEVMLDIMMAGYMAPGLSNIIVYEGYNWNDVLNRMATDNLAHQLSSSWCFYPTNATTEQIFQQMIAQGQSLFQASGDSGAYKGWIMPPADDPYVTVVGGTSLTTAGKGGPWQSETTWSGSGGGVSTVWPIPSYQQGVNMAAIGGSSTMRNVPDVALTADIQMFLIQNNGQAVSVGGTSAAAPLWAGFAALANQQAAAAKKPPVGFMNPLLYRIGTGSNLQSNMHDIITGNNQGFAAVPGYDLATGWGTPAGQALIDSLTGTSPAPSFTLTTSSSTASVAAGASAGSTITVNAQNGFSGAVNLTVSGLPAGVTASFTPASAMTTSTLTLTAASSATAGTSTISISGTSGTLTTITRLILTVTGPAGFTLTAQPASVSVAPGSSVTTSIAVTAQNGFSGAVVLSASGLPSGVTASFSPVSTSGTSTLTLQAASSAVAGTSTVTVAGVSGSLRSTVTLSLSVVLPSFTITAAPASLSIAQGGGGTSTLTVVPLNGFSSSVAFSASGLPTGVTATFSPLSVTRTSTLTLTAAATAVAGTATITVTGTGAGVSSKAAIVVTITPPPSFTLSATPASVGISPGGSGGSTIAISGQNGFNGAVSLVVSGLPAGVSAAFGSNGTLTFSATSAAAMGTSTVTVTGTSGTLTSKTTIAVTIAPVAPGFTLSATPASLILAPGTSGASTIAINAIGGFSGSVALSVSGLPGGVTATLSKTVVTFGAATTAASGNWTATITGKSGSITQTAIISLTVGPQPPATTTVNMASLYNVSGIVTDGSRFTNGGLDAGGRAYPAILPAVQTINGSVYSFGPPNAPDAVSSATVALPAGQYMTVKLLAAGVNGNQPSQTFTVTYTDGTVSTFTQSLSDWCTPQQYPGESSAVPLTYRDNSDGTRDVRPIAVYGYSFNLSSSKAVSAITLPKNRNVVVLAISLAKAVIAATAVQVNLASLFDTAGMTTDGRVFTGGLDGVGFSYSGNLLGRTQTINNMLFALGPVDAPDTVSGNGKTMQLPAGKYSALQMLATGVNGVQKAQPFKVIYGDGTNATFTQSFSDWFAPQNFAGESNAVSLAYRNASYGAKDNRTFQMYGYSFALDSSKTVSGMVMPIDVNVKVFAVTLAP